MPLLGSRGGASARGFGLFGAIPEPAPTVLGQEYGGGYYAGLISLTGSGSATHYLVVAPKALGEAQRQWKTANTATTNTGSVIDGKTNSSNMNNALHPAAQFCESLSIGGYGDWYMPARDELEVIYFNLKPSTQSNTTSSGANLNAVPSRASNYTTGDPSQSSVVLFQTGGAEAFETEFYWASTQFSTTNGWIQNFNDGEQSNVQKLSTTYVRAVRRVAI
jgi:hypothetical protein